MKIIDQSEATNETWRDGVETTVVFSAVEGASALCIFEQRIAAKCGAPTHRHSVEEILTIVEGIASVWVDDEVATLRAGQSALIPARSLHGFENIGEGPLQVRAVLSAPSFQAEYLESGKIVSRWRGEDQPEG